MKILGIDYGDARTGTSISDASLSLAGSPAVIRERSYEKLLDALVLLAQREDIGEIVVGNPKNMDGSAGARSEKCSILRDDLAKRTGLPIVLWDERRTTVQAHAILHQSGKKMKQHKQSVDAVAATLILQGYLDYRKHHAT